MLVSCDRWDGGIKASFRASLSKKDATKFELDPKTASRIKNQNLNYFTVNEIGNDSKDSECKCKCKCKCINEADSGYVMCEATIETSPLIKRDQPKQTFSLDFVPKWKIPVIVGQHFKTLIDHSSVIVYDYG